MRFQRGDQVAMVMGDPGEARRAIAEVAPQGSQQHPVAIDDRQRVDLIGDALDGLVRDKDFLKPNGPKVFHARMVRTGAKDVTNTEIIVGVAQGEVVATKESKLLANEDTGRAMSVPGYTGISRKTTQ